MDKLEILQSFNFFENSDEKFKKELLNESIYLKFKAGTIILSEGDNCNLIPLVGQGNIRVYKVGDSGREITLYHISPEESCILSISSILGETKFPANATVDTDTEVVAINESFLKEYITTNEELRSFVYKLMANRFSSVLYLLHELIFNKLDNRLSSYLLEQFENTSENVFNKTHEQIANDLGSSREVISRILKEFERSGAIKIQRGNIKLLNHSYLLDLNQK